jgi:hypothetical protein
MRYLGNFLYSLRPLWAADKKFNGSQVAVNAGGRLGSYLYDYSLMSLLKHILFK